VGLALADILLSKLKVVTSPTFFWISAMVMTAAVATRAALVEWRVIGNTLVVRQMCTTRRIPVDEIERVALKGTVLPSSRLQICTVVMRDRTSVRVPGTFRLSDRRCKREPNQLSVAVNAPVLLHDVTEY
jgi:hypothetical protein